MCMSVFVHFHSFFLGVRGQQMLYGLWAFCLPIFLSLPLPSFVVISVYCFLYIFQLERTKSYSKCQSSYLAKPYHSPSTLCPPRRGICLRYVFILCPAMKSRERLQTVEWTCFIYAHCTLLTDGCHCEWGNGIACGRGWALHMRTFCLYFSILKNVEMFQ